MQDKKRLKTSETEEVSTFEQQLAAFNDEEVEIHKTYESKPYRDTNSNSKWVRPEVKPIAESLVFQQIEIDSYLENQETCIVKLYGITMQGNSVCCHVHGFYPYFFIDMPKDIKMQDINLFSRTLNDLLRNEAKSKTHITTYVVKVECVKKQNLYGYHGGQLSNFLKITLAFPRLIAAAKRFLERGFDCSIATQQTIYQTYESNIDFEIRFMVDCNMVGGNWLEIPCTDYSLRHDTPNDEFFHEKLSGKDGFDKLSRCQIEVDVWDWKSIICHDSNKPEWSHIAPFRILSFDIECANRKGVFPDPMQDSVIQIGNMVMNHGDSTPSIRNVFTLNTCAPIIGSDVLSFQNESDMLRKWAEFVRQVDPDIITGYNIQNFDFPYLLNRAEALKANEFFYLGRIINRKSAFKESSIQSKQMGRRENKLISMDGRIIFDLFQIIMREHKLRSFSLNSVSFHFLEEQKEDVQHSIITDLQNGNEQTRRRLAVYCMKDAYLPLRLMNKLLSLINYIEMARVTGVPLNYLLTRGQQIKVLSQLLRKAKEKDLIIPAYQGETGEEFEGATVIEPSKGYYDTPIATLDFSSLYPSIMIAHNLCYSTLLLKDRYGVTTEDITQTPSDNCFVKKSVYSGILPEILTDLMAARKKVKQELKTETDIFKRQVLDGRQLAIKISANSVYGFTGAQVGKLPCLEISQSVTAYGRLMIEKTKSVVENHFNRQNGYETDAKLKGQLEMFKEQLEVFKDTLEVQMVIYGDTDSVMIKFDFDSLEKTMEMGKKVAEYVSEHFPSPIRLEFEKVYFPYLLINKKRYAGLSYSKPDHYDKLDCKGLETVRRDNCPLVSNLITTCLNMILIERNPKGATQYAIQTIADLLCNKIDISQLVVTKELTKTDKEYAGKQAHVELANKMRKRDAGSAPTLGDRIPYIIVAGSKGSAAYERAEDPIYVLENNIPIDTQYYLQNQLSKPLLRIFEPILGDKAESILLRGKHTLTKSISVAKTGGLSLFTTKQATCINCKTMIYADKSGSQVLCKFCMPQISQVYQRELLKLNDLEEKFSELWTECQRCSGSFHEDVLCTNQDCPIYYMRKKVQMDIGPQQRLLDKFCI